MMDDASDRRIALNSAKLPELLDASWANRPTPEAALAHSIPPAPPHSFQNGGENSRQCMEKLIGTVRSSCACGMFAGNAGSGSARMIISITSLSRSA
jgi:hypothetical protein